ncbi:hypothetical protein ACHAXR_010914 [Thalassiosira sp. AJA248-18]
MKTTEKGRGRSAAAKGRGGGGGRGTNNNHGRHPRQPPAKSSNKQQQAKQNQAGRGGGRPRSSSYNDKSTAPKKSGPYAHLFCSERHAFALSRVFYPRNDQFLLPSHQDSNIHRIASDEQFEQWWESVKIVRCHVPFNESADANSSKESNRLSFLERCPICLDEDMVSPFIAPCGHAFCLPCALGYLNSVAKDLNDESDRIHKNKQNVVKGNAGLVGCATLTTRATVTSVRSRCPMCSSGSSMVLNAGDAMITYKDLRPVVFVPTLAIIAAPVGEAKSGKGKKSGNLNNSNQLGTRMKFVKLHRVKSCSAPYLPLHGNRVRGATTTASSASTSEQCLPDLPDGDDDSGECIYTRQYFVGLKEYDNVLQRDLDDLTNYRENTVHCQLDSREDWNVSMAIEAVQAAQRRWAGSSGDDRGFRGMESEAKSAAIERIGADQMWLSETSVQNESACTNKDTKPQAKNQKNVSLLQPGSFFVQQRSESNSSQGGADELLYYQSSDGQPCFLSGINVACLMHEFALHQQHTEEQHVASEPPDDSKCAVANDAQDEDAESEKASPPSQQPLKAPNKPRNTLPLPDELTGTVVEIEQLAVTNSLIKRKPFLSNLPLTSSVSFVEIDWYSGGDGGNKPMLSHSTLSNFRGELNRRKSDRLRVAKREQKADKFARAKSEKDEQRRRRELLGTAYFDGGSRQTIDPDDEFFRAPTASFDGSEEEVQWNQSPTFQFNEVCATGGVWPELASSSNHGHEVAATSQMQTSPAVVASSSPPQSSTNWGSRNRSPATKQVIGKDRVAAAFPMQSSPAAFAPSSPPQSSTTWGSRNRRSPAAEKVVDNFPSLAESSHPMHVLQSNKGAKSNRPWSSR